MIYQVFTTLLKWKPTRYILLIVKHCKPVQKLVPMLREWYEKDFIHQCGVINLLGHGCVQEIKQIVDHHFFSRPLIVTDDSLVKFRIVETVEQQLKKLNINPIIYTGVVPNPTTKVVNEIKEKYLNEKCDALISIGGGSAHDSAKGAALIISNKRNIYKCQGLNVTKTKSLMPIVAINTTAGTGSEVTNVAVITNEISHFKMTLVDKHIQPLASINDSNMMLGLPQRITSWTGIDALVHAIEGYLSLVHNDLTDALALQAMKIIYKWLPIAYKDGSNKKAREQMSYAEFIAGTTFNSSSLGFIHSMSHAMSAVFNTPHGLANATIMPFVLEYELKNKKVAKKLCEISDGMGITNPFNDKISKANYCIKTIREFITGLGVPTSLVEVQKNITDRQINQMSKKAMKDFCGISNPIQFSRRQVKQIYRNAIKGII